MWSSGLRTLGSSAASGAASRYNPLGRLNPFSNRAPTPPQPPPIIPNVLGSVGPGMLGPGMLGPVQGPGQGPGSNRRGAPPSKPSTTVTISKILILLLLSAFIGLFFVYLYNKEKEFNFDVIDKIIVVVALMLAGIAVAYFLKLDVLNFIISSQINILCFYFLISYASLTTFFSSAGWGGFIRIFRNIFHIIEDPTQIFEKGFSLIIPLILFLIPVIILIYNATQSILLGILVLLASFAITYSLYPKNKNPIAGGTPLIDAIGVKTCVNSNWEYFNPLNIGLPKCGEEVKTCVDSNWNYANPFNWGKEKCK